MRQAGGREGMERGSHVLGVEFCQSAFECKMRSTDEIGYTRDHGYYPLLVPSMASRLEHDYESRRTIHSHSLLLYIHSPYITFILGNSGHYSFLVLGILHCHIPSMFDTWPFLV
jgi:hypothetical protein